MLKHTNLFLKNTDAFLKFCAICNISNIKYEIIGNNETIMLYYQTIAIDNVFCFLFAVKNLLTKGSYHKISTLLIEQYSLTA